MLKGMAILSMLMLHLFCRKENLPYTPLLWLGNTPLIYYFGLFGDICVAVYCFVSGYAHYMQSSEAQLRQAVETTFAIHDPILDNCGAVFAARYVYRKHRDSREHKGISP